jgi:hypothetical protein
LSVSGETASVGSRSYTLVMASCRQQRVRDVKLPRVPW